MQSNIQFWQDSDGSLDQEEIDAALDLLGDDAEPLRERFSKTTFPTGSITLDEFIEALSCGTVAQTQLCVDLLAQGLHLIHKEQRRKEIEVAQAELTKSILSELFLFCDEDQSGVIDKAELQQICRCLEMQSIKDEGLLQLCCKDQMSQMDFEFAMNMNDHVKTRQRAQQFIDAVQTLHMQRKVKAMLEAEAELDDAKQSGRSDRIEHAQSKVDATRVLIHANAFQFGTHNELGVNWDADLGDGMDLEDPEDLIDDELANVIEASS